MDPCGHGMDGMWCYLCRVESSGVEPRTAWGLDAWDRPEIPWEVRTAGMTDHQADYLRFLCREFGEPFDDTLTEGEADAIIDTFMDEAMDESQGRTLSWLCDHAGAPIPERLTYGRARAEIRRLVALRGLRSA